jgi:PST family polysaccharide transporter
MCIYNVIFPTWYFQGIEKMKFITYITLVSRLIFVALIFVFIHSDKDYLLLPIINGIGAMVAGIISLVIIFGKDKLRFRIQSFQRLKYYIRDTIPIFLSNVSVQIYVNTNKVIIGAFLGMSEVAYYDLAQKIITILKVPQAILGQTIFPKISKEKNLVFVRNIFKLSLLMNSILFLLVVLFSKKIVFLLGGMQMVNAVLVVNILAFTIPVIGMSNIFGVQLLISFGYKNTFTRGIVYSGIFYFIQALFIWKFIGFSIINVSIITVITEMFVTIYMIYYCQKYNLKIIKPFLRKRFKKS